MYLRFCESCELCYIYVLNVWSDQDHQTLLPLFCHQPYISISISYFYIYISISISSFYIYIFISISSLLFQSHLFVQILFQIFASNNNFSHKSPLRKSSAQTKSSKSHKLHKAPDHNQLAGAINVKTTACYFPLQDHRSNMCSSKSQWRGWALFVWPPMCAGGDDVVMRIVSNQDICNDLTEVKLFT